MKPFDKKEKSESSASDDSPPQRPKRNTCQKTAGVTNGLLWREETDLKKALYASLQENKRKNWEDGDEQIEEEEQNMSPEGAIENGEEESPKKAKIHAQRKFAQGSTPNSPVLTPQKVPSVNNASTQLLPYRRPKTEDFLTFLCLRGTSILPPSLDFLNSCSRSDTSSECRSLSPELEEYSSKDTISRNGDAREKGIKHENLLNGLSRKVGACKASSRRYVDTSTSVKKNLGNKEVVITKKRKIRDENEDPSKVSKSKSTGLNALREKYKKQRLAADKKKLAPVTSSKKVSVSKKPQDKNSSKSVLAPKTVPQKKQMKAIPVIQKVKLTKLQKKLAFEKRKCLRSADIRPRRLAALRKKTPWIRRAKLVPPIVDVESDSSEPEIIHATPKKDKEQVSNSSQKKVTKPSNVSDRLRSRNDQPKPKGNLTPRQMLLRKHMQNRMKTKKSVLHTKNIRSRTIVKQKAKATILRKARKNLVLKTMSLRKDLQNKRITRSAKNQIQEMLWSNPEKRAKAQNQKSIASSKIEKKKSTENQSKVFKKQKSTVETKKKDNEKVIKTVKDNLKRKSHSSPSNNKSAKQNVPTQKVTETSVNPAKISRRSLSRDEKQGSSAVKSVDHRVKSNTDARLSCNELKNKPSTHNDVKKESKNVLHDNAADQNKMHIVSKEQTFDVVSKSFKTSENLKNSVSCELNKVRSKSVEEKDNKASNVEKTKNDIGSSSNTIIIGSDKNVQNNLNLLIPEKTSNKDISNLMELNVNIEENAYVNSDPCSSTSVQVVKEKTVNRIHDIKFDPDKEINVSPEIKVKKNLDKKSLKKYSSKEENKSIKHSEKGKLTKKDKNIKSVKKHDVEEKHSKNNSEEVSDTKKGSHKKENAKLRIESDSEIDTKKSSHKKENVKLRIESDAESDTKKSSHKKENAKLRIESDSEIDTKKSSHKKENVKLRIESDAESDTKKSSHKKENAKLRIESDVESDIKKSYHKKENTKLRIESDTENDTKKSSHKKENSKLRIENDAEKSEIKKIKSDHEKKKTNKMIVEVSDINKSSFKKEGVKSKTESTEDKNELKKVKSDDYEKKDINKVDKKNQFCDLNNKNTENLFKKDNKTENSTLNNKNVTSDNEITSSDLRKDLNRISDSEKPIDDVFMVSNHSTVPISAMEKKICDNHQPCSSKEKPRNSVNSTSSSATNRETDDDSDYDLTLDQFIKLQALKASAANSSKSESSVKTSFNESKNVKANNKDLDKKIKKDGESSRHKKEKDGSKSKSHDKDQRTPKKEDKLSKKDPKSLAKLHKKEKSKSKKEEKSKHKKDGSSSKSKKDSDKDISKSSKSEDSSLLLNLDDFNADHSENKKDKTKKESKLSRSNSCDETKSPKKKKKHNEFKDIEKIKNLISKSSILSEISGFKEFRRRSSSDKSELKKLKKKKKLALLKDKKLSKKLSSKLLRKYSKKKGLKSKKKLLKKEFKDMKIAELEILSKSKKQKHKAKGDHHGKDTGDKIKNIESSSSVFSCKVTNTTSTSETAHLIAKVTESLAVSSCNSSSIIDNSQVCNSSANTVPTYIIESIPDGIPPIDTLPTHISQSIGASTEQYVFGSADELQGLVASDFTGVFEETFPTGAILLATRDTISQVPVHFIQDIAPPKTMADAATNTGEDDIEEIPEIPENLKNDEMSVGTQTMTPIGSPSPLVELHPLVLPQAIETLLKEKKGEEINSSFTSIPPIRSITAVTSSDTVPLVNQVEISSAVLPPKVSSVISPAKSEESLVKTTQSVTPPKTTPICNVSSVPLIKTDPSVTQSRSLPPVSQSKSPPPVSQSKSLSPVTQSNSIPSVTQANSIPSVTQAKSIPSITQAKTISSVTPSKTVSSISPMKTASSATPVITVPSMMPIVSLSSITPVKAVSPVKTVVQSSSSITPVKTVPGTITTKITPSVTPIKSVSPVTPKKTTDTVIPSKNNSMTTPLKTASPTVSPSKSVASNIINDVASVSPKPKRRSSFIKKSKTQSILLPEGQPFPLNSSKMVSAPVYHPTVEEFRDPLEYIFKIQAEAAQFGICKIVPPPSFKPECKVNDDMRFTAHNQYLHKMLNRWGPNVQHTACIKKHLKSQKVKLEQAPLIGGIELDISRFYHIVQQYGGLQQVIEKKKWQRVADTLRVPKTKSSTAQDRVTKLYDAYCKYLVSYDTLPKEEKEKLEKEVIADHERRVKLRNSHKDSDKEDDDFDEEENTDCVSKGRSMSLSNFFRIARNIMSMWFKNAPSPEEVEHEYWKVVTERQQNVVVHAGNIDSSVYQSGFACNRNSPFAKHPWNLKILTNNSNSLLRFMGPVSGVTIPTLHVGMLFTTGCWYRDPHSLPWIEYLHTGASKIWYSIPAKGCEKFRESMKKIMPEYCTNNPLWLPSDTAMVPPELLVQHGASLSRIIQNSGQFVVIFPESFTSTICCGYCVSESVYFAPTSWLDLAVKAFKDIQSSCEPPSFSLERLLLSIASELKSPVETLQKILPLIQNIRSKDTHLRAQLSEIGLKQWERLPIPDIKDKKKKTKIDEDYEFECEICRTHCYLSMVVTFLDETVYCLPHALEHIPKKNLKLCKLKYRYDEKDLKALEANISEHIAAHLVKQLKKKSPKKKLAPVPEK